MEYRSAEEIKPLFSGNQEVAFIDVREVAQYGGGHPFFVSHVAYSILEARIGLFVPCLKTTTVLIDDNDGISEKAAKRLEEIGYKNVLIVKGGIPAWDKAGYALYEGVSAPSKSFGEVVEHELGTISITADQLKARMDAGDDNFIILDGRTPAEFNRMTIPTSSSCPNAELVLRYGEIVSDENIDIIVNCAGRTRSLIGAQSLRILGIPNKVYALENGTMGWKLAGLELEYGAERSYPQDVSEELLKGTKARADELIDQYNIDLISHDDFKRLYKNKDKTTFLYDVRTEEEYTASHVSEARHTPGGQLVQATDQWFATRNGKIVLYDNQRIRAVMAAIWLKGMGHDAVILDESTVTEMVHIEEFEIDVSNINLVDENGLGEKITAGTTIVDVRSSEDFRKGHIEGAKWSIRPRLDGLNISGEVVVIASELLTATYVLKDLAVKGSISLSEPDDWVNVGLKVVSSPNDPVDADRIDFLFHTHGRHSGNMEHAREYLRWETGLMDQMDDQEKGTLNPLKP